MSGRRRRLGAALALLLCLGLAEAAAAAPQVTLIRTYNSDTRGQVFEVCRGRFDPPAGDPQNPAYCRGAVAYWSLGRWQRYNSGGSGPGGAAAGGTAKGGGSKKGTAVAKGVEPPSEAEASAPPVPPDGGSLDPTTVLGVENPLCGDPGQLERPPDPQLPLLALPRGRLSGRQLRLGHPHRSRRLRQLAVRARGLLHLADPLGDLARLADDPQGLPDRPRLRLLAQPLHRQPHPQRGRQRAHADLRTPDLALALDALRDPRRLGPLQRPDPAKGRRDARRDGDGAGDDARRDVDRPLPARDGRAGGGGGQQRLDDGGRRALLRAPRRPRALLQRRDGGGLGADERGALLRHGLLRRALVHDGEALPRSRRGGAQGPGRRRRLCPAAARGPALRRRPDARDQGALPRSQRPVRPRADDPRPLPALQPARRAARGALALLQRRARRTHRPAARNRAPAEHRRRQRRGGARQGRDAGSQRRPHPDGDGADLHRRADRRPACSCSGWR